MAGPLHRGDPLDGKELNEWPRRRWASSAAAGWARPCAGRPRASGVASTRPSARPSDAIIETAWGGMDVAMLNRHGPGHLINPSRVNYRANIYALKAVGCTHVIASGGRRQPARGHPPQGPGHPRPDHRQDLSPRRHASSTTTRRPRGVRLPVLPRAAEAPAELRRRRVHPTSTTAAPTSAWKAPPSPPAPRARCTAPGAATLIGMTCMPEAKLAREAELAYALVALPSDYDCWRPAPADLDKHELLKEIIGNLTEATRERHRPDPGGRWPVRPDRPDPQPCPRRAGTGHLVQQGPDLPRGQNQAGPARCQIPLGRLAWRAYGCSEPYVARTKSGMGMICPCLSTQARAVSASVSSSPVCLRRSL